MATPNYSYEKRQRELAKKRKNEEKRQRKLNKPADGSAEVGGTDGAPLEGEQPNDAAPTPAPGER